MIRHIVVWKFLDSALGADRPTNLMTAKRMLEKLPARIPWIRSFEVGLDMSRGPQSFDLALNATFDSRDDVLAYQAHPDHERVVLFLRAVQSGRVVTDYEI